VTVDWRRAGADELLAHVRDIDLAAFEEASLNEAFSEEHVRLLLEDPGLGGELLERISREPRFFQKASIRAGLAMHPRLPRVRALEILRYLYWRDLLRVAMRPAVHPQVRATAEHLVAERLPDLTLGERIAIARTARRGVLRVLRADPDPRVVDALLKSPACTEDDAVFMATSQDTPPAVLTLLARSPKWRMRSSVRHQLVRNRRLALPLALGLLAELSPGEIASVARQADLPKLLRESAARLWRELRDGSRASRT
jgi:hypothetical protein